MTEHDDIKVLSELIRQRNVLEREISVIIGRPAHPGHIGEFVASRIFDITLIRSASNRGFDGRFTHGKLAGMTVNVKKYSRNEGILDVSLKDAPDFYLVLTGARGPATTSRGTTQPWTIERVYLFDAAVVVERLRQFGVKIGTATSVRRILWNEAEIFPSPNNRLLTLTQEQADLIRMFR